MNKKNKKNKEKKEKNKKLKKKNPIKKTLKKSKKKISNKKNKETFKKKTTRKKPGLKEQYSKSWEFIKESRNFIYSVIGIFVLFIFIGIFLQPSESLFNALIKILEELYDKTLGMSTNELTGFIFLNNLQASFMGMISGIYLGILPIFYSIFNGYFIGFVIGQVIMSAEGSLFDLWRLFPHGIFELPAIFISFGLGIKIGDKFIQEYFKTNKRLHKIVLTIPFILLFLIITSLYAFNAMLASLGLSILMLIFLFLNIRIKSLKQNLIQSLKVFIFIIFPLLLIAAIIEGLLIGFSR
ncbi:MAG: stage II sporulation protein M [Nanoarchaeota archaeon]